MWVCIQNPSADNHIKAIETMRLVKRRFFILRTDAFRMIFFWLPHLGCFNLNSFYKQLVSDTFKKNRVLSWLCDLHRRL